MWRRKGRRTELDELLDRGTDEYMDNGGCLDIVRRDHYFTKVIDYARRLEDKLEHLGQLAKPNDRKNKI